jgi:hypothetical protein
MIILVSKTYLYKKSTKVLMLIIEKIIFQVIVEFNHLRTRKQGIESRSGLTESMVAPSLQPRKIFILPS